MINLMRKNQRVLWIVIAVLCIPFVLYFSNADIGAIGSNTLGRIYDRPVSHVEFQRHTRLFSLARELGMFTLLQDLVAGATSESEAYSEFTWNLLILRHEAERLGLRPSALEIANVVKGMRPFGGQTGFDLNKYNQFTKTTLPALGFTDAQIEELAADQLALARLKELIATGVHLPQAESRENYERAYGKLDIVVARLRAEDFAKELQISDEDVAKYYEANKEKLTTEEKRKVESVTFALNEEQKKLAGKERVEVLQKLADRANDFNQALLEKGAEFHQVAAKFEVPIQATGEFTKSSPDPQLAANPQLTTYAFQLTPQDPNTDAVQVGDGFQVLHLSGIDPAKPLTLEEAKPKILEAIKQERLREIVSNKAAEAAQKMRLAMQAGTPVEAAVQQAGLQAERIPPFALADSPAMKAEPGKPPEPEAPDMPLIKGAVAELSPGEVGEFVPTETGGLIPILEKRAQPEPGASEQARISFNERTLRSKRDLAFHEWLRERRRDAVVETAPG